MSTFFLKCYADHRALHSFPTRRSSDLPEARRSSGDPPALLVGVRRRDDGSPPPPDSNEKRDRKSTRLNSSHQIISYAVFCLKKKIHLLRLAPGTVYDEHRHVTVRHVEH